jgi:hypothetical protein
MRTESPEKRIFFNVITGRIKIISNSDRLNYATIFDLHSSRSQRLQQAIELLKIIKKFKSRQAVLADAQRKVIEVQINQKPKVAGV